MTEFFAVILIVVFVYLINKNIKKLAYLNSSEYKINEIKNKIINNEDIQIDLSSINYKDEEGIILLETILKLNYKKKLADILEQILLKKSEIYLNYIFDNYFAFNEKYRKILLEYLMIFKSKKSYVKLIEFLTEDDVNEVSFSNIKSNLLYADVIFPTLLDLYGRSENLDAEILDLFLEYLKNRLIFLEKDDNYIRKLSNIYRELSEYNFNLKKYEYSKKKEELLIIVIEIFGYIYDLEIIEELNKLLDSENIKLRISALISLLNLNIEMDGIKYIFEEYSSNILIREFIYNKLKDIDKIEFFPIKYYTLKSFSECDAYNCVIKDFDVEDFEFLDYQDVTKKLRVFYYKFNYRLESGELSDYYTVISGPFEMDKFFSLGFTKYCLEKYDENYRDCYKTELNNWILSYNQN